MNRIQLGVKQDISPPSAVSEISQSIVQRDDHATANHTFFVPLHYERNYAYPLLVWLHGAGDDERQLPRIMPMVSMRNYVAVGPRASKACESQSGFRWDGAESSIETAQQSVFDCIDLAAKRYSIARQRVFIAGYGCGGTMAFRLALGNPEQFAGVLSIGGSFPTGGTPLANLEQTRQVPLFVSAGRDAVGYPADQTCHDLRLFHVAGMSVTFRQYPGGDELTSQMLHDMDRWLMEQVTGVESATDAEESFRPDEAN